MTEAFKGAVQRAYPLEGKRVLILEADYRGDIGAGDPVDVILESGAVRAMVATIAWGSAFHADNPPLTLVVTGLDENPAQGVEVRGVLPA